jgi:hypothetical protein
MNGNEPAMPSTPLLHRVDTPTGLKEVGMFVHLGLTKRELLAAMAMQAIISKHPAITGDRTSAETQEFHREIAGGAVCYADALIKELSERAK